MLSGLSGRSAWIERAIPEVSKAQGEELGRLMRSWPREEDT